MGHKRQLRVGLFLFCLRVNNVIGNNWAQNSVRF